jgi:predicted HicB family RNase H-like nuclease
MSAAPKVGPPPAAASAPASDRELERYFAEHRPRRNPGKGTGRSGRLLVRLPQALHERLIASARSRGVSVNTLVVELLARGAG